MKRPRFTKPGNLARCWSQIETATETYACKAAGSLTETTRFKNNAMQRSIDVFLESAQDEPQPYSPDGFDFEFNTQTMNAHGNRIMPCARVRVCVCVCARACARVRVSVPVCMHACARVRVACGLE